MPQPFNYTIDVQSPIDSALKGFQTGLAIQDVQLQRADAELKRQDAERQRQTQIAQQQAIQNVLAKGRNITADDYGTLATLMPKESEHFKRAWELKSEEQKRADLGIATQILSATQSNNPEAAINLLQQQSAAMKNSGNENGAKFYDGMANLIRTSPSTAQLIAGNLVYNAIGPKEFAANFSKPAETAKIIAESPADLARKRADAEKAKFDARVRDIEAQKAAGTLTADIAEARAKAAKAEFDANIRGLESSDTPTRLRLANDLVASQIFGNEADTATKRERLGRVPQYLEEPLLKAQTEAATKMNAANKTFETINLIDKMISDNTLGKHGLDRGGVVSRVLDFMSTQAGFQNQGAFVRQQAQRLINEGVMASLPSAFNQNFSNTDREFVTAGVGSAYEDPTQLKKFLKAQAKAITFESANNLARARWLETNHSNGAANKDFDIDGVPVARGTSYDKFLERYAKKVNDSFEQRFGMQELIASGRFNRILGNQPQAAPQPNPTMSGMQAP